MSRRATVSFSRRTSRLARPRRHRRWARAPTSSCAPFSPGDYVFTTFVRLLLTRGKAKILSSPNLLVSAGSEASIITGQEVPVQSATVIGTSSNITTQFKRVGIKLRVGLLQITNDTARIELNPEVSTVTSFVNSGTAGDNSQVISNPVIAIRNVTSTLSLKDGEDSYRWGVV